MSYPISGDALRAGDAKTPSPDAEGRVRLRDPGLGVGDDGDPSYTVTGASPGAVAQISESGAVAESRSRAADHGDDGVASVQPQIADTVRSHPRPGSNSNGGIVVAAPLTKGSATGEGVNQTGRRQEDDVNIVAYSIGSHAGSDGEASNASHAAGGPVGMGIREGETPALRAGRTQTIAFHPTGGGAKDLSPTDNLAPGTGTGGTVAVSSAVGVRRLLPVECEALQGFPRGWTDLGGTADSKRYSALGDAVTVNVSHWIGSRLPA